MLTSLNRLVLATLLLTPELAAVQAQAASLPELQLTTGITLREPAPDVLEDTLAAARRGETARALPRLERWAASFPEQPRYAREALVVAGWAGQHAQVVAQWPALDRADTPSYVLRAIGFSARSSGQTNVAQAAYGRALQRDTTDWEAHAGLALTLLAEGQTRAAADHLDQLWPVLATVKPPLATLPVRQAQVTIALAMQEPLRAIGAYDTILAITPDDAAARQAQARLLSAVGAAPIAEERLTQTGPPASDLRRTLEQATYAARVRWAQADLDTGHGPERTRSTEALLAQDVLHLGLITVATDGLPPTAQAPILATVSQPLGLAAACDRLVALVNLGDMRAAISLHQAILRGRDHPVDGSVPAPMPAYCLAAAANAYLMREQPAMAGSLYREAIERQRADGQMPELDWRFGVVHALRDQGELVSARQEMELLLAAPTCGAPVIAGKSGADGNLGADGKPGVAGKSVPAGGSAPNPARLDCLTENALLHLDENQPGVAEDLLLPLRSAAPADGALRLAWAEVLTARQRPAAARTELKALLADEPQAVHARVALADNALAQHEIALARTGLEQVAAVAPNLGDLQRVQTDLANADRAYLTLSAGLDHGSSAANVNGGQALVLDTRLYSAPLVDDSDVRAFEHVYAGEGDLPGTTVRRTRLGVGASLRDGALDGEGELTKGKGGGETVGLSLALAWKCSDLWTVRGSYDTNTNLLPYLAYRNGVEGKRVGAHVTLTLDESRRFDLDGAHTAFSDGNRRGEAGASWTERWIGAPAYLLETTLSFDTSGNTLTNAAYFNPGRDHTVDLAINQEWQGWRQGRSSFAQGLVVDGGVYAQAGQSQGALYGLRYQHLWQLGDRLNYRYGLGLQRRPYDGIPSTRLFGFFDLNWIL